MTPNALVVVTTFSVKTFTAGATEETPFADLAAATAAYEVLERAYYSDEGSNVTSATFDRGYDEYLSWASTPPYKCVYCGQRSSTDDTVGFYCYAGPRGEHRYELVDGDE